MKPLEPEPPYVFPEPRVFTGMMNYPEDPPYEVLAFISQSVFGIISGLTGKGIKVIQGWLDRNPQFKATFVVMVYPACATSQADFAQLRDLVQREPDRLSVHVRPLERVTDRASNALCFLAADRTPHMVVGPTEDLGLAHPQEGHVNFVFRTEPALVESFKRYFDCMWAYSRDIAYMGASAIPALVLPEGSEEGARLWQAYMDEFGDATLPDETALEAQVNPETGAVTLRSKDGEELTPPTENAGIEKLDETAARVIRLYEKGALVSIDKLSRIPPLDTPLDPSIFGDLAEIHRGNVVRKVSMRVSIIDESDLKGIEKCRKGLRDLLTKFTFGLADNMRWMPNAALSLFETELKGLNEAGQKLIADLLKGNVEAFIQGKRDTLIADLTAMYQELGRPGPVTDDVVDRVVESLASRLGKAQTANFMPALSYSRIAFTQTETAFASPWGQAFSLLEDIAAFPRKAISDNFFFRGLKVPEDALIDAMNVADDSLVQEINQRRIKERCKAELDLLLRIEKSPQKPQEKCGLVFRLLDGDSIKTIDALLSVPGEKAKPA